MKLTFATVLIALLGTAQALSSSPPAAADFVKGAGDTNDTAQGPTIPLHHPLPIDGIGKPGVGSPCGDNEGAWFCMSSTFQRCASGQWSEVMTCAPGTVCEPAGLTDEPQSAFNIAPTTFTAVSTSTSATETSTVVDTSTTTSSTSTSTDSATSKTATGGASKSCSGATDTESTSCPEKTASSTAAPVKSDTSGASPSDGDMGTSLWPLGMICVGASWMMI